MPRPAFRIVKEKVMEKTVKIGNKSLKLSNNIGWAIIYRDQFGRDIIPSLMPMLASTMDIISGLVGEVGDKKEISFADIIKTVDGDALINAVIHLGGLEIVDLINITWAMAKAADDSIDEPKEWVRTFDSFPVDVIAPAVGELVFKGCVSSKNQKRLKSLKTKIKTIQPQNSTTLSSEASNEA